MSVHRIIPLDVADERIFLVRSGNALLVPARPLIETVLGMSWPAQAKKLDTLAAALKVRTLTVEYASGRVVTQPCVPVYRMGEYLWSLRPAKPESREVLLRLITHWHAAVSAFVGADHELSAAALVEAQKACANLLHAEAKAAAAAAAKNPVLARWTNAKPATKDAFIEIARLYREGKLPAEIAKIAGCAPGTVSLFIGGRYSSQSARDAYRQIEEEGWWAEVRAKAEANRVR